MRTPMPLPLLAPCFTEAAFPPAETSSMRTVLPSLLFFSMGESLNISSALFVWHRRKAEVKAQDRNYQRGRSNLTAIPPVKAVLFAPGSHSTPTGKTNWYCARRSWWITALPDKAPEAQVKVA